MRTVIPNFPPPAYHFKLRNLDSYSRMNVERAFSAILVGDKYKLEHLIQEEGVDPSFPMLLLQACSLCRMDCVKILLSAGSDPYVYWHDLAGGGTGWNPAHVACSRNHPDILKLLPDDLLSIPDSQGNLPVHIACEVGAKVISVLAEKKDFPLWADAANLSDKTPPDMACVYGTTALAVASSLGWSQPEWGERILDIIGPKTYDENFVEASRVILMDRAKREAMAFESDSPMAHAFPRKRL